MPPFVRLVLAGSLLAAGAAAAAPIPKNAPPPPHGFFSGLVRVFARVERVDLSARTVTFVEDGSGETRTQPLKLDTDVFLNEVASEAGALQPRSRVWIAMEGSAAKKEFGAVRFIADEPTYQALHGYWYTAQSVLPEGRRVTLVSGEGAEQQRAEIPAAAAFQLVAGSRERGFGELKPGMLVRYQSRWEEGRYVMSRAVSQLAAALNRARQAMALDAERAARGLPGHLLAGEGMSWTLAVHRTGSDWARRLREGESVSLIAAGRTETRAAVRAVGPWGEKTLVVLDAEAPPPAAETPVRLRMAAPAKSSLPAGLGTAAEPAQRIEWFLSTIYCTCPIVGDRCTGHLYTLSMCSPRGCGKPAAMRAVLAGYIERGLSDEQILRRLEQDEGPELLRPHLLK